jgi:hypothetical protein
MTDRWNPDFAVGNPMLSHLSFPDFADWPTHDDYNRILQGKPLFNENGRRLRFVEPQKTDYETRVFGQGDISTRPCNWHDFFNALIWFHFPKTKSRINALHCRESGAPRSAPGNALTHFDESGVVVLTSCPELADDLRNFRWKELFREKRARIKHHMAFLIFGHGLLEKALNPYVGMTGHGIVVEIDDILIGNGRIDEILSGRLEALANPSDLCPVPLLGYPGWDENNADPGYYDNENYFRTGRRGANRASMIIPAANPRPGK